MNINRKTLSIGNAAGTINNWKHFEQACANTCMTEILVGPITIEPRRRYKTDRSCERVYYYDKAGRFSVHHASEKPNVGFEEFTKHLSSIIEKAHRAGKQLGVSVAGKTAEEYAHMAARCFELGVDNVEIDGSHSNIWGEGKEFIPSHYTPLARRILLVIKLALPKDKQIDFKISPVDNDYTLGELADIIGQVQCVGRVVGIHGIPNWQCTAHDGYPAVRLKDGTRNSTLGGDPIFEEGLRVHQKMRERLPPKILYVATGGISSGDRLLQHLQLGASGFRLGTLYREKGPAAFLPILRSLKLSSRAA